MKKLLLIVMLSWSSLNLAFAAVQTDNVVIGHESIVPGYNQTDNTPQIIAPYDMQQYDQQIQHLYQTRLKPSITDMPTRVAIASQYFLGKPYVLGVLGEGADSKFDQQPLYRTDKFDCTTYTETVLALAQAKNLVEFKQIIKQVRYHDDQIFFVKRNHFTSIDWNPHNQNNGYIKDITAQFPVPYKTAVAFINKPNWYRHLSANNIKLLQPVSPQQAQQLTQQLHAQSQQVKAETSRIKYLPLSELFATNNGNITPNQKVFDQIPSGSIIEIVRANWDLTNKIGTHLNVGHMGLAIRTRQGLMFREASEIIGKVTDVPLEQYLAHYYQSLADPDAFGIHVETIVSDKNK